MRDSQGRAVTYPHPMRSAHPTSAALPAPSQHLLAIGACCFAIGWCAMAVVLRHTR